MSNLNTFDFGHSTLKKEWLVSIQTPTLAVDHFVQTLREKLTLTQGHYDCCVFVSGEGTQQFRALEGSHAGSEETIQAVATVEIIIAIPPNEAALRGAVDVIYEHHVHEEPTIRVTETWGARSNYIGDTHNPNKYWNRIDATEIHGETVKQEGGSKA